MRLTERLANIVRHKWVRIILVLPALLIIAAVSAGVDYCCYSGRIYPGIYLNEISLGGLSLKEAESKLAAELWSLEAVSYTHLDVYKRQVLLRQPTTARSATSLLFAMLVRFTYMTSKTIFFISMCLTL